MAKAAKEKRKEKVVEALNKARSMELTAISQYMNQHLQYNYFDNIKDHIEKLGNVYLAKIAGTSAATGIGPSGFAVSEEA